MMPEQFTRDTFAQHLNTQFRVQSSAASLIPLELVETTETASAPDYETFSIEFRGPSDMFLPQGTYRFVLDGLGSLDLFIVPIRNVQGGLYYEACFNRLLSAE
jgi:hypothetical protein